MTTINFNLVHAFCRTLEPGDEIVVTALDHDANVSPWLLCAEDHDLVVRIADVSDGDLQVEPAALEKVVGPRTKVCAFTLASNGVGTMPAGPRPGRRRPLRRRAGLDGLRALRAAPPHRREGAGRRRAAVLAVQVLRPAPGPRLRARGAAADLAGRSRAPGGRAAGGPPLRDRHDEPRGARGRARPRSTSSPRWARAPTGARSSTTPSATSSPTRRR